MALPSPVDQPTVPGRIEPGPRSPAGLIEARRRTEASTSDPRTLGRRHGRPWCCGPSSWLPGHPRPVPPLDRHHLRPADRHHPLTGAVPRPATAARPRVSVRRTPRRCGRPCRVSATGSPAHAAALPGRPTTALSVRRADCASGWSRSHSPDGDSGLVSRETSATLTTAASTGGRPDSAAVRGPDRVGRPGRLARRELPRSTPQSEANRRDYLLAPPSRPVVGRVVSPAPFGPRRRVGVTGASGGLGGGWHRPACGRHHGRPASGGGDCWGDRLRRPAALLGAGPHRVLGRPPRGVTIPNADCHRRTPDADCGRRGNQ